MDDRGRIALPARYRDILGSSVIVSQGPDGCLDVYAPDAFEHKAERILSDSTTRQRDRRLARAFFGGAAEAEIDRQGRILIPPTFRQWAELTGPVVIIGQGRFLEIWSASRWETESPQVEGDYSRALEAMEPR
jgi:MraZ protein